MDPNFMFNQNNNWNPQQNMHPHHSQQHAQQQQQAFPHFQHPQQPQQPQFGQQQQNQFALQQAQHAQQQMLHQAAQQQQQQHLQQQQQQQQQRWTPMMPGQQFHPQMNQAHPGAMPQAQGMPMQHHPQHPMAQQAPYQFQQMQQMHQAQAQAQAQAKSQAQAQQRGSVGPPGTPQSQHVMAQLPDSSQSHFYTSAPGPDGMPAPAMPTPTPPRNASPHVSGMPPTSMQAPSSTPAMQAPTPQHSARQSTAIRQPIPTTSRQASVSTPTSTHANLPTSQEQVEHEPIILQLNSELIRAAQNLQNLGRSVPLAEIEGRVPPPDIKEWAEIMKCLNSNLSWCVNSQTPGPTIMNSPVADPAVQELYSRLQRSLSGWQGRPTNTRPPSQSGMPSTQRPQHQGQMMPPLQAPSQPFYQQAAPSI